MLSDFAEKAPVTCLGQVQTNASAWYSHWSVRGAVACVCVTCYSSLPNYAVFPSLYWACVLFGFDDLSTFGRRPTFQLYYIYTYNYFTISVKLLFHWYPIPIILIKYIGIVILLLQFLIKPIYSSKNKIELKHCHHSKTSLFNIYLFSLSSIRHNSILLMRFPQWHITSYIFASKQFCHVN